MSIIIKKLKDSKVKSKLYFKSDNEEELYMEKAEEILHNKFAGKTYDFTVYYNFTKGNLYNPPDADETTYEMEIEDAWLDFDNEIYFLIEGKEMSASFKELKIPEANSPKEQLKILESLDFKEIMERVNDCCDDIQEIYENLPKDDYDWDWDAFIR